MMAAEQNRILTPVEAAEMAQVTVDTIYLAIKNGQLRHGRLSRGKAGKIRISEAALREWIFGDAS